MKLYDLGEQYYSNGDYQKALETFTKIYESEKNDDALNYMGCCLMHLGYFSDALIVFDKVIEANPKWERPIMNKGRIYLKLKDYKKAMPLFKKAIELNPENEDVLYYMGLYYERLGDYEKAKLNYRKALLINPIQPETRINLGNIYYRLGNFEAAKQEFEITYAQNNNFFDALINIGLVNCELEKYDEAIKCLKNVLQHLPNDLGVMYDLAWVYFKQSEFQKSLIIIEKILNKDPQNELGIRLKREIEAKKK